MQHTTYEQQRLPFIVDEDIGIPSSLIDEYRTSSESGPTGPADPRSLLLSMSEYDKTQSYDQYGKSFASHRICLRNDSVLRMGLRM